MFPALVLKEPDVILNSVGHRFKELTCDKVFLLHLSSFSVFFALLISIIIQRTWVTSFGKSSLLPDPSRGKPKLHRETHPCWPQRDLNWPFKYSTCDFLIFSHVCLVHGLIPYANSVTHSCVYMSIKRRYMYSLEQTVKWKDGWNRNNRKVFCFTFVCSVPNI